MKWLAMMKSADASGWEVELLAVVDHVDGDQLAGLKLWVVAHQIRHVHAVDIGDARAGRRRQGRVQRTDLKAFAAEVAARQPAPAHLEADHAGRRAGPGRELLQACLRGGGGAHSCDLLRPGGTPCVAREAAAQPRRRVLPVTGAVVRHQQVALLPAAVGGARRPLRHVVGNSVAAHHDRPAARSLDAAGDAVDAALEPVGGGLVPGAGEAEAEDRRALHHECGGPDVGVGEAGVFPARARQRQQLQRPVQGPAPAPLGLALPAPAGTRHRHPGNIQGPAQQGKPSVGEDPAVGVQEAQPLVLEQLGRLSIGCEVEHGALELQQPVLDALQLIEQLPASSSVRSGPVEQDHQLVLLAGRVLAVGLEEGGQGRRAERRPHEMYEADHSAPACATLSSSARLIVLEAWIERRLRSAAGRPRTASRIARTHTRPLRSRSAV